MRWLASRSTGDGSVLHWLQLRWPADLSAANVQGFWNAALAHGVSGLVIEVEGSGGSLTHRLGVPESLNTTIRSLLQGLLPAALQRPSASDVGW